MDEAYKAQLDRMAYLQNEIRKLKSISGMIDVSATNIFVTSAYFEKVIDLFDEVTFAIDDSFTSTDGYTVRGYIGTKRYTAFPNKDKYVKLLFRTGNIEQAIKLLDSWRFAPIKDVEYDHRIWGYLDGIEYKANCTDHELVDLLANNISNFAKPLTETEPNHKVICKCDAKTPKVEPVFADLLEKVFGKGNA